MSKPVPTRLYFIRHGEVEARYQRVFGGRLDIDLSPLGVEQAHRVAEHLRHTHFDAVYVSPMKRAQRTLQPLAAGNGYRPVTLDGLREVDFGAWTGFTWDEVRERFGKSAYDWLHELEGGGIPEAEPIPDWRRRVDGCLDQILASHPGRTVAVICHGGVIRMALACLLDLPVPKLAHFEVDYASITVVDHRPGRPEVQLLNFTPWRKLP
jgi:broad specificity phosphatase PhoE